MPEVSTNRNGLRALLADFVDGFDTLLPVQALMTTADEKLLLKWRPCSVDEMNCIAQLTVPRECRESLAAKIATFQANHEKAEKRAKTSERGDAGEAVAVRTSEQQQGRDVDVDFSSDEQDD
jgi:hypothetical protein